MSKQNKQEADYRLPEQCCSNCMASYQNDYGDYQCTQLTAGEVIDAGAICNLYVKAADEDHLKPKLLRTEPVPKRQRVFEMEPEQTDKNCISCMYSTDSSGIPICMLTYAPIKNVNKGCRKYDRATDSGADTSTSIPVASDNMADDQQSEVVNNCGNCAHSYLDDQSVAFCRHLGIQLQNYEKCDNWELDNELNLDNADSNGDTDIHLAQDDMPVASIGANGEDCSNCRFSIYNAAGVPFCLACDDEIDMDDLSPCEQYESGEENATEDSSTDEQGIDVDSDCSSSAN